MIQKQKEKKNHIKIQLSLPDIQNREKVSTKFITNQNKVQLKP